MATVGGIDLELDDPGVIAGAIFLADPDRAGWSDWTNGPFRRVPVDSDHVVLVGNEAAFVSLTGSVNPEDVAFGSLEVAQRALDLEAAHAEPPLALRRADEQHIEWRRVGDEPVLRIVITRPLLVSAHASVGVVQRYLESTTGTGDLPTWGPGLRFFRLFQLSTDIFDAYRNAFLALEALLDAAVPAGAPDGEYKWLKFALTEVPSKYGIDLQHYLVGPQVNDAVSQFLDEQYKAKRCALFHAKSSKGSILLPGATDDRREVAAALEPLIRVILGLIRGIHNIVFPSGGMVVGGFRSVVHSLNSSGYELALLHDPDPAVARTRQDMDGLCQVRLSTCHAGQLDSAGLIHGFTAEADPSTLGSFKFNSVISYTRVPTPDGVLGMPYAPNGLLSRTVLPVIDPGSVRVQVLIRWVLDNLTMPRSRFAL